MDIFLLGAGRPAHGLKPSALKKIGLNSNVMDWQIHSFSSISKKSKIHYLGGYNIADVVKNYPLLDYTIIPNWQSSSILHTFLKAPFTEQPAVVAYSDTVFRKEIILKMLSIEADVVFCIDSLWKERFSSRTTDDIQSAETIKIKGSCGSNLDVEFTGLVYFNRKAVKYVSNLKESDIGSSMMDLIIYLRKSGLSVKNYDVTGHWAEFNEPSDLTHFILGTKSETLARLEPLVTKSLIGKQVMFTYEDWLSNPKSVLDKISSKFNNATLIVRSSSKAEDSWVTSNAGGFNSLLNVDGGDREIISDAINFVITSYRNKKTNEDQVLVQEFLSDVLLSGVVFTCNLESGSPYYRFNFDENTNKTESVTSGSHNDLRTIIVSRKKTDLLQNIEPKLVPVLRAIEELEQLLCFDKLDIEFAIDSLGTVHIFQARPITVDHSEFEVDSLMIEKELFKCQNKFNQLQQPSPFILGNKTIFANMPDWNPAEIIGTRPKPLAFSLYRQLITNDIWAQQRVEYGYRDVRPSPLIYSFAGHPYVDTRASFNSFIPATLPEDVAERLVNAYTNILSDNSQYHDKIEFNVVFTIWSPGFIAKASSRLQPYGVTLDDISQLELALKEITKQAFIRLHGDTSSIDSMSLRRKAIISSKLSNIDKINVLLDDCKRIGTLGFSHAARAGFVATIWLKSFVEMGVFSNERRLSFLKSINTVTSEFEADKFAFSVGELSSEKLIEKYGHLRPGTYEITSKAYWEDPNRYLLSECFHERVTTLNFEFSVKEQKKIEMILSELGTSLPVDKIIEYLNEAIISREFVKFEFTRNLSASLDICVDLQLELNLSREDMSFLIYSDLEQLKFNTITLEDLHKNIIFRKQQYVVTSSIDLPSILEKDSDFYCFERCLAQPNFVTIEMIEAPVIKLDANKDIDVRGKVILIKQADPGYDWLFGQGIVGLITQYGGANSHMAIRSAEIGLPAAIGVGEKLYDKIANMKLIKLDCANQVIHKIQ